MRTATAGSSWQVRTLRLDGVCVLCRGPIPKGTRGPARKTQYPTRWERAHRTCLWPEGGERGAVP